MTVVNRLFLQWLQKSKDTEKLSHQDYCHWVDERTGFSMKSSDGSPRQVQIPKKMKRIIDGDLASIADDKTCSTKDRLRQKLRQKQREREKQMSQESNDQRATTETNESNLGKSRKRRKRNKKATKSDEVCNDIVIGQQTTNASEKQESGQLVINDEINANEVKSESWGTSYEAENSNREKTVGNLSKVSKIYPKDNFMIQKTVDMADMHAVTVRKYEYGDIIEGHFENIDSVSGEIKYLLDHDVNSTTEPREEIVQLSSQFEIDINANTSTQSGSIMRPDIPISTDMFGKKIYLFLDCMYFRKNLKKKFSVQKLLLELTSKILCEHSEYRNIYKMEKDILQSCYFRFTRSKHMIEMLKVLILSTPLELKISTQDPRFINLPDNLKVCGRYHGKQIQQVGTVKLECSIDTSNEMTHEHNQMKCEDSRDDVHMKLSKEIEIENASLLEYKIANTVTQVDETNLGNAIVKSTKPIEVNVSVEALFVKEDVQNVNDSLCLIDSVEQNATIKNNKLIQDLKKKRQTELLELFDKYFFKQQQNQTNYVDYEMLTPKVKALTDIKHFLLKTIPWFIQKPTLKTASQSPAMTDVIVNAGMLVLIKLPRFMLKAECIEAKYPIEILCNNSKITGSLRFEIPLKNVNVTSPLVRYTPRSIFTVQQIKTIVVNLDNDMTEKLVDMESIYTEFFMKNLLEKFQNILYIGDTYRHTKYIFNTCKEMYTRAKLKSIVVCQDVAKKKYLQVMQKSVQMKSAETDVHLNQSVKVFIACNTSVKTFLTKLHRAMFENNCWAKNDNNLQNIQRSNIRQATHTNKAIRSIQHIDSFKTSRSCCLLEETFQERDTIGDDPKNCQTTDLCSDHIEQENVSTHQQGIDENSQIRKLEEIEQTHYGIRLCIFD